jgi:hypothetical protein
MHALPGENAEKPGALFILTARAIICPWKQFPPGYAASAVSRISRNTR